MLSLLLEPLSMKLHVVSYNTTLALRAAANRPAGFQDTFNALLGSGEEPGHNNSKAGALKARSLEFRGVPNSRARRIAHQQAQPSLQHSLQPYWELFLGEHKGSWPPPSLCQRRLCGRQHKAWSKTL